MKKVFLFLTALSLVVVLSSCGGNKSTEQGEQKTDIQKVEKLLKDLSYEESKTEEAANMCLKEGFNISTKFAELKPSFKIIDEKSAFLGDVVGRSYTALAVYPKAGEGDAQKVTDEEVHEVVKKVYAITAAVADGGKNIKGYEKSDDPEVAKMEYPLDEILAQSGIFADYAWRFIQDGKIRGARVEVKDVLGGKENAIRIEIYTTALQKSFKSTMDDAEKALDDPEVQKVLEEALEK